MLCPETHGIPLEAGGSLNKLMVFLLGLDLGGAKGAQALGLDGRIAGCLGVGALKAFGFVRSLVS